MEKLEQNISAPDPKKGLFGRLREWVRGRFGKQQERVPVHTHIREEIPELKAKSSKPVPVARQQSPANNVAHEMKKPEAPKAVKQEPPQAPVQKTPESKPTAKTETPQGKPAFKIKPKKMGIPDLNPLSNEEYTRRLTGESHLEDEEIHRIINPSAKDLAAKNEPPKDIRPTLKDYPSEIVNKDEDQLNLHDQTKEDAKRAIRPFVIEMQRKSKRLIRIVTGKGIHSDPEKGPALKSVAVEEIQKLKNEGRVFKFHWEKGNSGALLVYLT